MDYRPNYYSNRNAVDKSNRYKKKRIFWLNSSFNSDFVLIDNKIYEISWDIPPFEIYKNNRLKLLTYIRDSNQSKPIQIKLKLPLTQSRNIINTDKEAFPIIYTNHTGVEMMTYGSNPIIRLIPQQITRFTFRLDDNFNQLDYNYYFSSITNGSVFQVANGNPDDKYIIFNSSGSFVLDKNLICDILVVGGGGGGGAAHGGGGGAGALIYETNKNLNSGTYTITVGSGGAGSTSRGITGNSGNDTSVNLSGLGNIYLAKGGGGGGAVSNGADGGSGGGASPDNTVFGSAVNTNIPSGIYGNNGGQRVTETNGQPTYMAGGGGGAGAVGGNASVNANGSIAAAGNGGIGRQISITGANTYYAGGGGGGTYRTITLNFTAGIGGLGGGGNGNKNGAGSAAIPNTGGGGGGGSGSPDSAGGNGGSGVVIIRFKETRIEGITAEENLIQTTNNTITVNTDSKYVINYQNPVNIPKGTYETIFSSGNIYLSNKKFPKPWGAYFADDWSGTTLLDSSGNNRHATTAGTITKTTAFGNGANAPITYISGGSSASITFPAGSLATNWTILSLIRISNSTNTASSFFTANTGENFVIGYYYGNRGVGYLGSSFDNTNIGNKTDWLSYIIKNSNTTNNVLVDGIQKTISGTFGNSRLSINNGFYTSDDWVLSAVIIWDSHLTDSQMIELNTLVENFKQTGRSLKNDLWLSNDKSYPILKDANNTTINPLVWYQFDTSGNLGSDSMGIHDLTNPNGVAFSNDYIKGNGSASFDGVNDHLIKDSSFNLNSKSWSISVWFKKTANSRNDWLFELGTGLSAGTTLTCGYRNTNVIGISNYSNDLNTAATYNDAGNWVHLCFTFLTGTKQATIYRNGVQVAQSNFTIELNTNNNFRIGKLDTLYCQGLMDDFRIYESVLTATQVSELYNGRISIYNPPAFLTGFELEDEDLFKENTISSYK